MSLPASRQAGTSPCKREDSWGTGVTHEARTRSIVIRIGTG